MALLSCLDEGHVQTYFKFLRNHSVFLHYAREGVLVASCEGCDLFNFRGRDIARIDPTYAPSIGVNFEHDSRRVFSIHLKKPLQNDNHEIHRCEIVVQQQDLVKRWRLELCALRLE
jgi:hypothetical protein